MTDTQQGRVYAAQARCSAGAQLSLEAAQAWMARVVNVDWWPERFPSVESIEVGRMDHRQRWGGVSGFDPECNCGLIEVRDNTSERTLVHELAHVCAQAELGGDLGGGHGPHFVRTYLELMYRLLGQEAWMQLREAMLAEGVDIGE